MTDQFKDEAEKSIYIATYQDLDGSNYTLGGIDVKFASGQDGSASFLIGGGADFANKKYEFITELRGKLNYTDNFNCNARVRAKAGSTNGDMSQICEFRLSPVAADIPVSKNTSIYLNPYYKLKSDLHGKTSHHVGAFTGVSHKLSNKISGFAEVECNDVLKRNLQQNTSINLGLRVNF